MELLSRCPEKFHCPVPLETLAQTQTLKQTSIWFQTQEKFWVSNPGLILGFKQTRNILNPEKTIFWFTLIGPIPKLDFSFENIIQNLIFLLHQVKVMKNLKYYQTVKKDISKI